MLDPMAYLRRTVMELRILLARRDYGAAVDKSDAAMERLQEIITRGRSHPAVWQSMLFEWSRLDAMQLEAYVKAGRGAEDCLTVAEAAKGRLYRLYRVISTLGPGELADQQVMKSLVSPRAQRQAVDAARQWQQARPDRRLASLFCSSPGIAIFSLSERGADCHWIDGPVYDRFRDGVYNHWEQLSDWALDSRLQDAALQVGAPPDLVLNSAQALSELLLDWLGNLLAGAMPELAAGGEELVVVPHRCLRSLPLAHARLPDGRCLSQLFERVTIAPTLADFIPTAPAGAADGGQPLMFLDPEGDLPLARLEGLLGSDWPARIGGDATVAGFREALAQPGAMQLSAHSHFDPLEPFASWLALADGAIELSALYRGETIRRQLVILSSCESGLSQRSNSDEPFGFPALLQSAGVSRVIAPSWRVDDLATLLLMSEFHRLIAAGQEPEQAIYQASHWLRQLDAEQALERIDSIEAVIPADEGAGFATARADLALQQSWLRRHQHDVRFPFQSPIFWAGFQAHGSARSTH